MIIDIDGKKPDNISEENWEKLKKLASEMFVEEFGKEVNHG